MRYSQLNNVANEFVKSGLRLVTAQRRLKHAIKGPIQFTYYFLRKNLKNFRSVMKQIQAT